MLDLNFIRNNKETVLNGLKKKQSSIDEQFIDQIIQLDETRRDLQQQTDSLRAQKNEASDKIAQLQGDEKQAAIMKMKEVSDQEKDLSQKLKDAETKLKEMMLQVPNLPAADVPEGGEADNKPFKIVGELPKFDFEPKDHVELGKLLDIIDIESGQNCSGARFYYLKNEAVLLQFALIQYALNKLTTKGFIPVIPPVLVREEAMFASGFFPADRSEVYHVNPEEDDLYLVGTAEVPLTMLHYDQILDEAKLPIRYFGYSSCFRREAGSYGKDTRGILRVHQFDKIEMYSFCHPDKSAAEHELIRETEEEIMQDLGLPYQVINICAGDLGAPATKKYDIEAWIPTQNSYRELTSCSNCTTYQANRAKIRYRTPTNEIAPLHTLNGTAIAIARMLIALIENNQQADGSVKIPKILRPFMNNQESIQPK
ncbi:serine--tRNA ligase [Candidatus Peregrinibacteria bacterium CG11_big_fil_rev_8_21_14_0_20_41_10]|nr:MAG: serine--tRNA ligase [Candidatus Peregrinibacteria bacterium CG11_big_fil_rev_8_21_14_0_20_41_10]